jgi:hypothetical protein
MGRRLFLERPIGFVIDKDDGIRFHFPGMATAFK